MLDRPTTYHILQCKGFIDAVIGLSILDVALDEFVS